MKEVSSTLSDESIIIFTAGVLLILFGLGIAVVRIDGDSFQKDRRRYGKPIPLLNTMGWYYLFRYRLFRASFTVMSIIFGIALVYYAVSNRNLLPYGGDVMTLSTPKG